MRVAGLDLSASTSRCSGYAVVDAERSLLLKIMCLRLDEEIVNAILSDSVKVVAIDAPLTPNPRMRDVDRLMIKMGFKVFPPNFSWMKVLSIRGYKLKLVLEDMGIEVIETHPRSALISSACQDPYELAKALGIELPSSLTSVIANSKYRKDLEDALVCACVAYAYLNNLDTNICSGGDCIYLIRQVCLKEQLNL